MLPVAKSFTLHFFKKKQIAKTTYTFYFLLDPTSILTFLPGQYIRLILPINATDNRGNSRFFTIVSSPTDKKYLMITTKIDKSDFKQRLANLRINERVNFFGPLGGFYFEETDTAEKVFLAGGIGITPFHSMIVYAAEKKIQTPLTLLASFSNQEEMIYFKELTNIAKTNSNIKVVFALTNPENSHIDWKGETGRISHRLINKYVPVITMPNYYIVGSPSMVEEIEELLEEIGVSLDKIKVEQFIGY